MIGVEKNQKVIRLPRMSLMSRKCTVRADSNSANPNVSTSWINTATGNHASSRMLTGHWNQIMKTASIESPKKKCTMLESTVTIGSTSAGNRTFLMRFPPEINDPDDSSNDEANQVQGSNPQNRNNS